MAVPVKDLSLKYRADIDGLRAIAILFVLFFHGGLSLFPSGFIGVDIFFVISGFLITQLIQVGLKNENFSFVHFYNRRLWRLQPVFICLLVVTSCMALWFYLPEDLLLFSKSARKTALFLSNQYFERVTTGYFALDTQQLPLLNTWSLAIEWQAYLILPVLIYGIHRLLKNYSAYALFVLMLVFLGLTLYCSHHYPTKTYYYCSSRLFEFLIGACLVFMPRYKLSHFGALSLGLMAFLVLFFVATANNIAAGFPNGYALLVCLATASLLFLGAQEHPPFMLRWLSTKPLVGIGLLSYSLYIWHWPLFALVRYQYLPETTGNLLLIFMSIFILAYLSWRFIEKPARKYHKLPFQYALSGLMLLPFSLTYLNDYAIKHHEGYPERFQEVDSVYQKLNQAIAPKRASCLQQKVTAVDKDCHLGAVQEGSQKALMIGDSFSNHYWGFMDVLGQEANISILAHATIACLSLPGIYQYDWYEKNTVYQVCFDQTKQYYRMIKHNHYDYVFIGQNWNGYLGDKIVHTEKDERSFDLSQKRIAEALEKALQKIIASGAKPVLIKPTAYIDANLHDCFFRHFKRHSIYNPNECNFSLHVEEHRWINTLFAEMKKLYPQLIIIDPKKAQCVQGACIAALDGVPVFRDREHLTDYASYALAKRYLKQYKNPFQNL